MLFLTQKTHSAAGCTFWYVVWEQKYIYTLLTALSTSVKQSEINDSKIWADSWYKALLFVTELRHTTDDHRINRSDYWWRSEVQESWHAHKTEWLWPAYSFWWKFWLFFSVSSWQSSTATLEECFCTSTARIFALLLLLLCLNSTVLLLFLYAACSFKSNSQALCIVSNVAVTQKETCQPLQFVLMLAI